ncbi:translation factor [Rhizoclosmatium globosum]|uniref:Threonylcarbamoyl-AMP synthase n=1 Tax=Rhizoclosmatium globosum TaxID=329046 RepID=A0A1Y2C658_9FUNG|nr:translation factor [Rhizoclosmatium globosum]|eukprot:ORY42519.1 translation factor [Rhizoclosmatium globosum]
MNHPTTVTTTIEQLLALPQPPGPGFPLVLKVSPSSFRFNDGVLEPPSNDNERNDHSSVALAAALIRAGRVVAFPTETVYGLGADATNEAAVKRVFEAKGRPSDNPLIVHVSSLDMLSTHLLPQNTPIPSQYSNVLASHWPGPLTILLPKSDAVPPVVTAGHDSVAVRMPSHPVARALIAKANVPIAAPSANTSTRPSPTQASHVHQDLSGRILLILDGGSCEGGLESTVLDALRPPPYVVLRPGGVTVEMLRKLDGFKDTLVFKKTKENETSSEVLAPVTPGMKYKHYSPRIPVILFEVDQSVLHSTIQTRILRLHAEKSKPSSTLTPHQSSSTPAPETLTIGLLQTETQMPLDFSLTTDTLTHPRIRIIHRLLGSSRAEVGRNLFAALREMETECHVCFVEGVREVEEGLAVMNRVRKAAGEIVYDSK